MKQWQMQYEAKSTAAGIFIKFWKTDVDGR